MNAVDDLIGQVGADCGADKDLMIRALATAVVGMFGAASSGFNRWPPIEPPKPPRKPPHKDIA